MRVPYERLSMMSKDVFDRRAAEMKCRMLKVEPPVTSVPAGERTCSLSVAAVELGVSYKTALRLLANEDGVRRYSTTSSKDAVVYPGTRLKRNQRVRMTYVIPESVVDRVKHMMEGTLAA